MKWFLTVAILAAGMLISLSAGQAQTVATHATVSGISATQVLAKQRVRMNWQSVTTANKYRVKILHNGTRIAKQTVNVNRAKFKERKFKDGETYVVYVRAKARPGYAVASWATYSFVFNDIDHDNDLILDTEDLDDDNDGIPDASDTNSTGVSGVVYNIVISNNTLEHGTITIAPGDSVTWVNQDDFDHTIVETNNRWFSPPLEYNESYTHIFDEVGVFTYGDPTFGQSSMSGTISVVQP